jgi:hypothetical protein
MLKIRVKTKCIFKSSIMTITSYFGRIRNETLSTPGVFVFELGWDQVLDVRERFRVSGLFLNVAEPEALDRRSS